MSSGNRGGVSEAAWYKRLAPVSAFKVNSGSTKDCITERQGFSTVFIS